MIRATTGTDKDAIFAIIKDSNQFDENGIAQVEETLGEYLAGESEGFWLTADDGEPVGIAYCSPEPVTDGTWNLLMLWTRRNRYDQGFGSSLVARVEQILTGRDTRLEIVETFGLPYFETARAFTANAASRRRRGLKTFSRQATIRLFMLDLSEEN